MTDKIVTRKATVYGILTTHVNERFLLLSPFPIERDSWQPDGCLQWLVTPFVIGGEANLHAIWDEPMQDWMTIHNPACHVAVMGSYSIQYVAPHDINIEVNKVETEEEVINTKLTDAELEDVEMLA